MSVRRKFKLTKSSTKRWKPRQYQQKCVSAGLLKSYLALFLDPGLGKTSIILQIFNKRKIRKQVKGLLVVAPLNPCYMTWPNEITEWSNFKRFSFCVLHGPHKDKLFNEKHDIYIINPEGLKWLKTKLKGKRKVNWPFDMLAVDESSKFKSWKSTQTKIINRIAPAFKVRIIANGTPVGNGFLGLMSQMRIVDQGQSLGAKIGFYREKYFNQVGKPEWAQYKLKKDADKKIMKKIAPFSISLKAEDHVDMPAVVEKNIYITLPKNIQKKYNEIEQELFTILDEENELIAESASSLAIKLHQFCNGTIYKDQDPLAKPLPSDKRDIITLHKEKLDVLNNTWEELSNQQMLIGYKFRHDKKALKEYFKNDIFFFDDAKTGKDKNILQDKWNEGKIKLLAGNPKSVGHGLNLQKGNASHVFLYSLDHDYETYDQFVRRLRRSGNASKSITVFHALAKGLYDHQIVYPCIKNKQNMQDTFLYNLREYKKRRLLKNNA